MWYFIYQNIIILFLILKKYIERKNLWLKIHLLLSCYYLLLGTFYDPTFCVFFASGSSEAGATIFPASEPTESKEAPCSLHHMVYVDQPFIIDFADLPQGIFRDFHPPKNCIILHYNILSVLFHCFVHFYLNLVSKNDSVHPWREKKNE